MTVAELSLVLQSAIVLALLCVVAFHLWPSYRLDRFRQSMFALRDELFDYAADGNIDFDSPAHRLLRQSMNGFIQYAHHLSLYRLLMTELIWRFAAEKPRLTWSKKWEFALKSIEDPQVQAEMQKFHARALWLVVRQIVTGSPVLFCILVFLLVCVMIRSGWQNLRQVQRSVASSVVSKIVDTKLLEEEAANAAAA